MRPPRRGRLLQQWAGCDRRKTDEILGASAARKANAARVSQLNASSNSNTWLAVCASDLSHLPASVLV